MTTHRASAAVLPERLKILILCCALGVLLAVRTRISLLLTPPTLPTAHAADAGGAIAAPDREILWDPASLSSWDMLCADSGSGFGYAKKGDGAFVLHVTQSDGVAWHVQFQQSGITLKESQTYILTFRARADRPRTMEIVGQIDHGDFDNIGLSQAADLGTVWQSYRYVFQAYDTQPRRVSAPVFNLGDQSGTVWLSGVSLKEESD